jgi:uncharacterized protein (TIRG00374 family)
MKPTIVRKIRWAAIALLIVGLLAYVRRIPWATAIATMRHASPELLVLALCFHLLALCGKAGIWWTFLQPLGGPRITTVARGTLMGATLNSLFVGSSGEAGRVLLMSRLTGIPSSSVLATVVLERAVDLCGFLTLLGWAAFLYPVPVELRIGTAVVLGIVIPIVLTQRLRSRPDAGDTARETESRSLAQRCRRYLGRVLSSTRDIASTRRLTIAIALTLVDWCSELASYSLVARAAHFPIGVHGSLLILLAVNVGFLVRVTPGNVGVFELVYASVAHSLGFPTDVAIGVALLLHLVQDVPTALLGLSLGTRFFAGAPLPRLQVPRVRTSAHSLRTNPSTAPQAEPARSVSP